MRQITRTVAHLALSPGFVITRALLLLGSWGVTLLAGTAIGIRLRQRILSA